MARDGHSYKQRIADAGLAEEPRARDQEKEAPMADAGPPLVLTAIGLILWLAVDATLAGISIQTIGVILAVIGVIWLLIELVVRPRRRATVVREQPVAREPVVRERPVAREREIY
jgi:hypothetical protein